MNGTLPTYFAGWSIDLGVLLILLGIFAISLPLFTGIAVSVLWGFLILLGAVAHLTYAWFQRGFGSALWQVLIGAVYLLAALFIFWHPLSEVVALTLVFAVYIGIEGVLELAFFTAIRRHPGTSWFLADGIMCLILAGLILIGWPSSSAWAIGTLVGISFLMSGFPRLIMPFTTGAFS